VTLLYLYKIISYKEMTLKQRRQGIATLNLRISYTTVTTPASRTADKSKDTGKLLKSVEQGIMKDYLAEIM
jgi:hypothetical protein